MKASKVELENAILIIAKSLNMEKSAKAILDYSGAYSIIKELIYRMFIENREQYFEKDDDVFKSISLIREYCREMSTNGEVQFNVPYKN